MQPVYNISNFFKPTGPFRYCTLIAAMLMILVLGWISDAQADYSFRKRITIDHNKVMGSATHLYDFPVLIDIINDADLKSAANGGHVQNPSGYDIVFKDQSGNQLDHEMLRYSGAFGTVRAFVRIPQLANLSDTIIYIHYGDGSVGSSQENQTGVWDSDYELVLHLQESGNGSTDEYKDSTGNGHHGTGGGLAGTGDNTYTPDRVNGLFGFAQDFDNRGSDAGPDSDIIRLDQVDDQAWTALTVQAWVNSDNATQFARIFNKAWAGGGNNTVWSITQNKSNTRGHFQSNATLGTKEQGSHPVNTWSLVSIEWDSGSDRLRVYRNGIELGQTNVSGTDFFDHTEPPSIGALPSRWNAFDGQIQEVRLSRVRRQTDWMQTEYNNQVSPSTFYSLGNEEGSTPMYTVSATANLGGTIDPSGVEIVAEGSDRSYTITATAGYEIADLIVNGDSQGVESSWDLVDIDQDYTIVAQFALIDGGGDDADDDDDPPPTALNGCGQVDVDVDYSSGFKEVELTTINTDVDPITGHVVLRTGYAAIDKENIVIPFDQEIFVNAIYNAGRVDLGYSLLEDCVDPVTGDFIGFENIPVEKRHGIFRGAYDQGTAKGDGVFDDIYSHGGFPVDRDAAAEDEVAAYDDWTGRPFLVDDNGVLDSRDMRKSLGTFAGGTELIFWLVKWDVKINGFKVEEAHYEDAVMTADDLKWIFFNKSDWNPDWYNSCQPDPPGYGPIVKPDPTGPTFDKTTQLGVVGTEGQCNVTGGWLADGATERLLDDFGLELADSDYTMAVTVGEKFDHFMVGAPENDPNQWILGVEQNNSQEVYKLVDMDPPLIKRSDVDCNDMVFKIERKTGGRAELKEEHAITSGVAGASFTGVTLEVWDRMPCGEDDNSINYQLSIDNGANWLTVNGWDEIHESNDNKDILALIEPHNWSPGSPEYTYRTVQMDFAGHGLTGHEIRWRADLISTNEACEPRILDLAIRATVMSDAEVSRAGPVIKSNVLYSGSYEVKHGGDGEELRGHIKATRIWDIERPEEAYTPDLLWDAGVELNNKTPASRKILIPAITVYTHSEQISTGQGPGTEEDDHKTFSGTLTHGKIVAGSVTITDVHESFSDKHTDDLVGNLGGKGKIDRFSGEFTIKFNTAPNDGVPIMAHYKYYVAASALDDFNTTNVSATKLGLDDSYIEGKGYTYDFDKDGSFDASDDSQWLINWVRGAKDGGSLKKDWMLGAIDHSMQALQTPPATPDWFYGTAVTKAQRKSFLDFVAANKDRKTVLYNGARDGMLHAFDAGHYSHNQNNECPARLDGKERNRGCFLDYGTGEELWAFIPANLIPRLKNNVLQGDDQAYVDASPALADVYTDGQWRTVLLSAQGNGGDSVFALDVTDPLNPTFMWEFADPDLFRSRSSPSLGKIGRILVDGEAVWAAFFVSGKTYDADMFPSIYIINVADGSVIDRVMLDDNESGRGGVPSGQPTIIDSDGNGYIDRLYIGTNKGFLYKVNVPDDPAMVQYGFSNCVINKDYDFTDKDGNLQSVHVDQRYHPIYGSPVVIAKNWVDADGAITYDIKIMFGTGDSPYYDDDIDVGNTRYHFFTYSDQTKKGVCDSSQVSLDWFIELDAGHRVFSSAFSAAGKVYFGTATTETEDPCDTPSGSGAKGFLYYIDILNGPPSDISTVRKDVGNTVISPVVYDEQVYVKNATAEIISFGSRKYDNEREENGFPTLEIHAWREFF